LRFYILSDPAGALEPCGCVKDQLGGLDHVGAFIASERERAPASALLSAGPLFFLDPVLKDDHRAQDVMKAETMAAALASMGIIAFAPGQNDWAAGGAELEKLRVESGAALVSGNLAADGVPAGWGAPIVREINGVKVGVFGVSAPEQGVGAAHLGVTEKSTPEESAKAQASALKSQGAQVLLALSAVGRGTAKRIADLVPDLTAVIVGSAGGAGDTNTEAPAAERLGDVLVLQTGNHLTTVAVLDLFVRNGSFSFADASGIDQERKRAELTRRIDELRGKIAQWESSANSNASAGDVNARKTDVATLEKELASIEHGRPPPARGSFFQYRVVEVRESLGKDPHVNDKLVAYYKQVNAANKVAFAERRPRAPAPGEASYIGVEACTTCHDEPRAVWDKTRHAQAYATLSKQYKEYNLDCVGCHVTGYDQAGGSTVTHVDKLKDVQCEVCHGPGSRHAAKPKIAMPVAKPAPSTCITCHHPPHVHEFDAEAKMADILGPGHGKPD
jgi:hypothetical protein